MTTQEIVSKLWNLCNVLRDDGITYHQYVTELTYILFLKMAKETDKEKDFPKLFFKNKKMDNGKEVIEIVETPYSWDSMTSKKGTELKSFYAKVNTTFGTEGEGNVKDIFNGAISNINAPANLETIISNINKIDWFDAREEGLGNLYEGLLEKNANP